MRTVIVMLKDREFKQRKEEIVKLAENAGYEILGIFSQNSRPRPKFLIGEGKVKEIKKSQTHTATRINLGAALFIN